MMLLKIKRNFKIMGLLFFISTIVYADESVTKLDFDNYANTQDANLISKDLHSQLNAIYKRNSFLKSKLVMTDKSLNQILATLKILDDKLEYKMKSNSIETNTDNVTLADFNAKDDDLIRKCDEIVDNYYSRKTIQEKKYVQHLFNSEQNDPQWERTVEDQMQSFIDENNLGESEFFDINCKNSVCKMRVQHKSSDASQQFKYKFQDDPRFDVYSSRNKYDRVSGGIITDVTLLKDSRQVRNFIWGK